MRIQWISALFGVAILASGCVSELPNPQENVRAQAWAQVKSITQATPTGNNRLRITASVAPGYGIAQLESDLLIRAGGEAVRRGADRFVIVYLDYQDSGVGDLLMVPEYSDGSRDWIGSYENLLKARSDNDPDGSLSKLLTFKKVTAVVRMLAPGEEADRETFWAEDTYLSLLFDRIERRHIKPQRTLKMPQLRRRAKSPQ